MDLKKYFTDNLTIHQRQYEAIRDVAFSKNTYKEVAKKFNMSKKYLENLVYKLKKGGFILFPKIKPGPKIRRTNDTLKEKIIIYRKKKMSTYEISKKLIEEGNKISQKTVERILKDVGFNKLKRRTNRELGKTNKNKELPKRSEHINFKTLKPFNIDCPVAGVFFFLPYIIETGIIDIIKKCKLPKSNNIGSVQACLSMLLLKLVGHNRLSQMDSYDSEPGLGIFSGLNILPKATFMNTYSCLTSEKMLLNFQQKIIINFTKMYPDFYCSDFINLDFHSIPHYGDKAEMEKIWCGAKGKTLKGANTVFAQDSKSNVILYTRADILRKEETQEIIKFVSYWKKIKGTVNETLVFDCKFTKYDVLDKLAKDDIKFITLRKRNKNLIDKTLKLSEDKWNKVHLSIPKRKYKNISVYENNVTLAGCKKTFRQIIIKDHGREKPTFIITNNMDLSLVTVLEVYAKRWHIENKFSELVAFFNLNALSSPLMIRIHFDILWTCIADTLYHRFVQDLKRFEKLIAPTIFKKFINMPGRLVYDGEKFYLKIRKRSYTPILKGIKKLTKPFSVPWLNNKTLEIVWTP